MKKRNKIILWIIFVIAIIAIIVTMHYDYKNLKKMSAKINATITNVSITTDHDGKQHYQAKYEFEINNKKYFGKYSSGKEKNVNDLIEIKYDPQEPENNCEESEDNSMLSSIVSIVSVIVLLIELAYIEEKTVNKKGQKTEEESLAIKKLHNLISIITLALFIITVIFTIYSLNHEVMISMRFLIYFSFAMIFILFLAYRRINKTICKVEDDPVLMEEIEKCEEIKCETSSVYFAKTHLIEVGFNLKIIEYYDILLMSLEEEYDSDGPNTYYILIITKDFNKHRIANIKLSNSPCHIKIMEEIRSRVPNVLEGYTKENKKIIKEMKTNEKDI